MSSTDDVVEAAARWAAGDGRVRALVLKGSLGRGEGDARSDVDLVVVTQPGALAELWAARAVLARRMLDGWLGGFDEAPWQAPHTYIGFYDGPVKVDFFFQDGEPRSDPWLLDGFRVLYDPDGVCASLPGAVPPPPGLDELDAHAWDWLWWLDVKLARGELWLVHVELVKFAETVLIFGSNALAGEWWRGASGATPVASVLPAAPEAAELGRALTAAVSEWESLRVRLAASAGMPLADELASQVRAGLASNMRPAG